MKRLMLSAVAAIAAVTASAQGGNTGYGGPDGDYKARAERILNLEKKTEGFNLYLNYAGSFQQTLDPLTSAFRAKQFRLEIKGQFGDHLTYRFRHRLNKSNAAMSEENFAKATDIMLLGWRFNDKFAIQAGKMCQWWGGFEFDENPMYIYQYSDLLDCMDNFLTGVAFIYNPIPSQEFVVNITNSYSGKFADEYGAGARIQGSLDQLTAADTPLCYILNWNGSFFGGIFKTRWSVGSYTQAHRLHADGDVVSGKDLHDRLLYLGQSLNFKKFQVYFDYMGNYEQLDRMRIASDLLCESGTYLDNVRYDSYVAKANWQFLPRFNLMGKFMYETAGRFGLDPFRVSKGYVASLEFYPQADQDLRFFLACAGKDWEFRGNGNPASRGERFNRIELGFMYRIKCY